MERPEVLVRDSFQQAWKDGASVEPEQGTDKACKPQKTHETRFAHPSWRRNRAKRPTCVPLLARQSAAALAIRLAVPLPRMKATASS
jgi:hypothetical protein